MWNLRRKFARSLLLLSHCNNFSSTTYHTDVRSTQFIYQHVNPFKPSNSCSIKPSTTYHTDVRSTQFIYQHVNPFKPSNSCSIKPSGFPIFFSSSASTRVGTSDSDELDENQLQDDGEQLVQSNDSVENFELEREVELIIDIIRRAGRNCVDVRNNLEKCGFIPSPELITGVLSQVRNDWEMAFTFFLWAGNQPDYSHSLRHYHSMIAILGKARRFDTAWTLIEEMKRGGKNGGESTVTPQTLLIMIRRYCAVHDVGKAMNTFYAYKQFNFEVSIDSFHDLLSALCRYKNVKEAESLMLCNKDVYPLTTKSFNIILNGWCNIICSPREGKRIWWEMINRGIHLDVISYSTIITCYSKSKETREVIKIFDEMIATGINPDRKVYNAVIHSLAKSGLVVKARDLMKSMEEKGIPPNSITYNSLIMPLCKAQCSSDAHEVFDEMLQRGLMPTVRTYHAFFQASRTSEEAFSILKRMNAMGCFPNHDTYVMLIRKFSRWREVENVGKIWSEMISNGLDPDRSSYVARVHGLFLNGRLEEAYKYHVEMKEKGLIPEPDIEERMEAWIASKQRGEASMETKCSDL